MNLQLRAFARPLVALVMFCLASVCSSLAFAQQLSIDDVAIAEGDSGTKSLVFTIRLSAAVDRRVNFDVATADGSALAGSDYTATAGTGLRIPAGETTKMFAVPILGDVAPEPNETFSVTLSNVVGATISDNQAIGTITNDDAVAGPTLSISDATAWEGNSGNSPIIFTVTLSEPATSDVRFTVTTAAGTASGAASDYYAFSSFEYIRAGDTETQVYATLIGDTQVEPDETFFLNLSDPVGAVIADGQAMGTILDDDANPVPPGAPTNVVATASLLGADVTFDAPAFTGGVITGYTVTASPAGPVDDWAGSNTRSHHMSGLVKGTYYTFTVIATNGAGAGPASQPSNSVRVLELPGPVGNVRLEPGDHMVTVSFDPPVEQGDFEIYGYRVSTTDDSGFDDDWNSDATTHRVRGLTAGTAYTFVIQALTAQGGGDEFVTGPATPTGVPGAPVMGTATINGSVATVTFSPPAFDGGHPITGYVVRGDYSTCPFAADMDSGSPSLSHRVNNLPRNSPCYLVVQAVNSAGEGARSEPSNPVTYDSPELNISFPQVQEGDSGTSVATFTFSLSRTTDHPVSFDVSTSNGTATAGSDYVARSGVHLVIPAGETSVNFDVTFNGDTESEADETFQSNITNLDGAYRLPPMYGQATIHNDDPLPQLAIDDASIQEGSSGSALMTFNVHLDFPAPCDVRYTATPGGGTARNGPDYYSPIVYGVIPKGSSQGSVKIEIYGDLVVEPDETFDVTLSNVVCATVTDGSATGTIINDDTPPLPSISLSDVSFPEGNSQSGIGVNVSLSAATDHVVAFNLATADGSAVAGQDYVALNVSGQIAAGETSALVFIQINGDAVEEPDETILVNLSNVTGATVADSQAEYTIRNDDAGSTPALSITDVSVAEGDSGTKSATFTVNLSTAQSGPVFFDLSTADGTAMAGSDYVAKATSGMRIPAGNTSKTFTVVINGDTTPEGDEKFYLVLTNAVGATITDSQAVGTITNDDAAATPTVSIADASVSEGNSGTKTLTFTVSLSPAASGTVSYDIATSNGTATAGSDYVASSLVGQTISAGGTSKTFAVTINGDTTTEANETFNVTLSNVSGATLGDGSALGTIINDDGSGGGTPSISIADVSMAEGNSLSKQMTFTVKLSAAATGPVTYNIATANGTALAPGDYTAKSLTGQSIAAGATSKTFTVAIKGDKVVEPNETFTVNLTGVSGATVGDAQAVGTITNDDSAAIGIARIDTGGLVDDIDDGNREPVLSRDEYALLLLDAANRLCARAPQANVIAVDGVEHRQALADLAAAANTACAGKPRFAAVMGAEGRMGFLVEAGKTEALEAPRNDAAGVATLRLLGVGQAAPVTLLAPPPLSAQAKQRSAQLAAIGRSVRSLLAQDEDARLVLIGDVVVPGLRDLTALELARDEAAKQALPVERVLVSPSLLEGAALRLPPVPATDPPAQVLQLH